MMKTRSENLGFDDSFDVTKCLQQIEMPDLLHVCSEGNEQPSNIKTMGAADLGRIYRRVPTTRTAGYRHFVGGRHGAILEGPNIKWIPDSKSVLETMSRESRRCPELVGSSRLEVRGGGPGTPRKVIPRRQPQ